MSIWVCRVAVVLPTPAVHRGPSLLLNHLYSPKSTRAAKKLSSSNPSYYFSTSNSSSRDIDSIPKSPVLSAHSHHKKSPLGTLSSAQKEQISLYVGTLLEWNQRMNLTAVKDEGEVMTRHVEDSLAILPHILRRCPTRSGVYPSENLNLVDVGSGAGLPGLVFAVACPDWRITLLESMQKRCVFLNHAVDVMGLSNVHILCDRAESVGQNQEFREVFDVAVARAVAEMRILAEYCLPLVRVGGLFVAAKGHDPQEEVKLAENAVRLMGASILELCSVESHSPHGQRTAIICQKDHHTPRKYPRQPGIPSKMPL